MGARPFVSVKFSPIGRTMTFLVPELDLDAQDELATDPPVDRSDTAVEARLPHPLPSPGERIVVRTEAGPALGTVQRAVPMLVDRKPPAEGAEVVRRATHADILARMKHEQRERDAHRVCQLKIRERQLPMKLARVEQLFDGSRLIFYYTAEGRVDFRELVRDLAAHFRVRIEMRQIGVRDEAKMLGGYGVCGRPLCCTTWLTSFEPVSIKMAKQQHLSLNPSKLSGMCGRLKCCLRYELPNGKGVRHGGCADEGGGCGNPTGPGCGGCSSGGCGSCRR